MTGLPDNNFPAFHAAAKKLRHIGFEVVNPAEIVVLGPTTDPTYYHRCLRADIRAMMDCDTIALLPGWEHSSGANLELHLAHRVGLYVRFVDALLPP